MTTAWGPSLVFVAFAAALAQGCGSDSSGNSTFVVTPPADVDSGGPVGPILSDDSGASSDAGTCVPSYESADGKTLDLLILLDKSSSTAGTKWNAAVTALSAFVTDARSAGLRVGLQLFPRPIDSTPACSFGAYATLRVPFTTLPAGASTLQSVLQSETPEGVTTPTYPALGGALLGAANEVALRPTTDVGAVLLVTDGDPVGPSPLCGGVDPAILASIEALAANAFRAPQSVRTFVIGLPGVTQSTIDGIAAAGGTTRGFLVDGSQVQTALAQALNVVRNAAIPCEYGLPAAVVAGTVSLAFVNVSYTSAPGAAREVIAQTTDCSTGGWTYKTAGASTSIVICPTTCERLRQSDTGKVDVALGCATVIR